MSKLADKIVFVAQQDAIEKVEIEFYDLWHGEMKLKYISMTFDQEALDACVDNFIKDSTYCEIEGKTYYKSFGMWGLIKTEEFDSIMEDFAKPNFKKEEIKAWQNQKRML